MAGVHNKNLKLKKVVHKKGITVKTVWLFSPGFPIHYPKKLALVIVATGTTILKKSFRF